MLLSGSNDSEKNHFTYVCDYKYLFINRCVCAHAHVYEERKGDTVEQIKQNLTVAHSGLEVQGIFRTLLANIL